MTNENVNSTESSNKNKQKPGLNAIRPSDYVEESFKGMARNTNRTQTELFETMFWNFINDTRENKKESALSLESEVSLLSADINNIFNHFKIIVEKAQDTVMSITSNADQTNKNLNQDIDTLNSKVMEIQKRNGELEITNSTFNELKEGLIKKNDDLSEKLLERDAEIKKLKETAKDNEKQIKDFEKQDSMREKELSNLYKNVKDLEDAAAAQQAKIKNLEINKESLQSTLNSIEPLKKAEIASIEAKYQAIVSDYETRINNLKNNNSKELSALENLKKVEIASIETKYKGIMADYENRITASENSKSKELEVLEQRLRIELESNKKYAIAEITLELADIKSKYGEILVENANFKIKKPIASKKQKELEE